MATQPPEATVPQWSHAYALENERQHRELATQIAAIRGEIANVENRLIKWIVAQFFAATVAASSIALLVQQLFGD